MGKGVIICILSFFLLGGVCWCADGFTQEDRELLIELKAKFEEMDKRFGLMERRISELREDMNKRFELVNKRFEDINKRFEDINKRFEDINQRFEQIMTFLWILTAIFTTLTLGVIGFAYWDRRTILRRAKEEAVMEIEREGRLRDLIGALRELAKEDRRLAQVLRGFNLL